MGAPFGGFRLPAAPAPPNTPRSATCWRTRRGRCASGPPVQQQRQHGGSPRRARSAAAATVTGHRDEVASTTSSTDRPATAAASVRADVDRVAPARRLVRRAQVAQVGRRGRDRRASARSSRPTAARWSATDAGQQRVARRPGRSTTTSGRAGQVVAPAAPAVDARRRRAPRRPARRGRTPRGPASRHSGASAKTSVRPASAISSAGIRPRAPNSPPGHILRGSSTCVSPRSSRRPPRAAVSTDGAACERRRAAPPVHTEHRPHGSAVGSSSDSWSSCIRQRSPRDVGAHDVGLAAADRDDAVVVLGVVRPRLAGAQPAALDPLDRAVDRELLEHQLDPAAAQPGLGLERRHARRLARRRAVQAGEQPARPGPGRGSSRWRSSPTPRRRRRDGSSTTVAWSIARPARPTCW